MSSDMSDFAARRTMMVDTQVRPSDVTKYPIIAAMLLIERENYVPDTKKEAAYVGDNLDVGHGRTMLAPRSFAKLLDALSIQPGETVLDIGCGLGYSSAVLAQLAATVVALESVAELADAARHNLAGAGLTNVSVHQGTLAMGHAASGPYDVILVEGGAEHVAPELIAQLAEGGRLGVVMMQGALGIVKIGLKSQGKVSWRFAFNATAPILPGFAAERAFAL
jgi:protein-L-isoaspartate(D-aspartate) O-methyltransferase